MQTFEIKLFIANVEEIFQVQEDKTIAGTYQVNQDFKFVTSIFKDADGIWKSHEISDISPLIIREIGKEIEAKVNL